MIRLVVFLLAISQLPLVALSQQPTAKPGEKRVSDAYYLRRQQAKTEAAARKESLSAAAGEVVPDANQTDFGMATPAGAGAQLVGAAQSFSEASFPQQQGMTIEEVEGPQGMPLGGQSAEAGTTERVPAGASFQQDEFDPNMPCDDGEGSILFGRFAAAYYAVPTQNVLWHEIYSCRCMWVDLDYLGWWVKGNHVPPLVTTSPLGTPQNQAGVLGAPNTTILFGNERVNSEMRSGGRITIGGWLVGDVLGIEGNYFALGNPHQDFTASGSFRNPGDTGPIVARPFFDANTGTNRAQLAAFPNFTVPMTTNVFNLSGSDHVATSSEVQSAGILLRRLAGVNLANDHRVFFLGGYRFFRLQEGLGITDNIFPTNNLIPPNVQITNIDNFGTKNLFNGGDFGLMSDLRRGRWVVETTGKVALGNMHEVTSISGATIRNDGTSISLFDGGLLTQRSNIGTFRHNQFALIPEFNFKLGYQLTCNWRATIGYNFTYVTRAARPGNAVDQVVSAPLAAGGPQPAPVQGPFFRNNPTDLWLQGFTVGGEFRW